jgi:hypothetical protein
MEVLKPVQDVQVEPKGEKAPIQPEVLNGLTLDVISNLKYLGLEDQMFDTDVTEKVQEITDFLGDRDIMELDVKVGNPYGLSKLDNLYAYVQLERQTQQIREKEQLIMQQKLKYRQI